MCIRDSIEVQVFRDRFGNAVYFPERDCSLQRNKQKVIEESPCSLISEDKRRELGEIAVRAVNGIDYLNTGTLEFLMDQDQNFYFMEMNTRIQVEHKMCIRDSYLGGGGSRIRRRSGGVRRSG